MAIIIKYLPSYLTRLIICAHTCLNSQSSVFCATETRLHYSRESQEFEISIFDTNDTADTILHSNYDTTDLGANPTTI